ADAPALWLDVVHKGVKLKFRKAVVEHWGVPHLYAVLLSTIVGVTLLVFMITRVKVVWIAAVISFVYGVLVILPGVLVFKLWRWLGSFASATIDVSSEQKVISTRSISSCATRCIWEAFSYLLVYV